MIRKLRSYENVQVSDVYNKLSQIVTKIAEQQEQSGAEDISDLPPSVLSTELLYEVAICYDLLYTRLMEKDLVNAGQHNSTSTIH